MLLESVIEHDGPIETDIGTFNGSIFSDGTIIGQMYLPRGKLTEFKFEKVIF